MAQVAQNSDCANTFGRVEYTGSYENALTLIPCNFHTPERQLMLWYKGRSLILKLLTISWLKIIRLEERPALLDNSLPSMVV